MLHDGGHFYRFALRIDRSLYDRYAIADLCFVSKFCLECTLHVLTYV